MEFELYVAAGACDAGNHTSCGSGSGGGDGGGSVAAAGHGGGGGGSVAAAGYGGGGRGGGGGADRGRAGGHGGGGGGGGDSDCVECCGTIPDSTEAAGTTQNMDGKTPIDFFQLYFGDELMELILAKSKRYANQYIDSHSDYLSNHPRARTHDFRRCPFISAELDRFLVIVIIMGVVSLPKISQYWSKRWPFHSNNNRFLLFLKFLHLVNNDTYIPHGQQGHDKLFKVRPILDVFVSKFQSVYCPGREISIDEGRLSFLQYMPKKPTKWGAKAWVLADSVSGYTCNLQIYTGKEQGSADGLNLGEKVMLILSQDLFDKGHHAYFDSF